MTLSAGAPPLAEDILAAIAAATALKACRTTNLPRASTTTLTADPVLTVPVLANRMYRVEALILTTADVTADIKIDFTGPSGSAHAYNAYTLNRALAQGAATPFDARYGEDGLALAIPVGGTTYATQRSQIHCVGTLDTAGTAGSFTLRWAQNASNATATIVYAGSWLRLEEMS